MSNLVSNIMVVDTRDLGAMARFLIGPGASYITGQDFAVDGGALAFGY